MNIQLFLFQLNQLLQHENTANSLEDVCDLLRTHVNAAVTVTGINGQTIIELLPPQEAPGGEQNRLIMPIMAGNSAVGSLSICRFGDPFSKDETLAAEVAFSVCTILLRQQNTKDAADMQKRRDAVRNLINTLSFSELEAATEILKELAGKHEMLLVAGNIADRLGFTRSVITGALKKLEGAGLVETRSLGMKGTYIRVKEPVLAEELRKL